MDFQFDCLQNINNHLEICKHFLLDLGIANMADIFRKIHLCIHFCINKIHLLCKFHSYIVALKKSILYLLIIKHVSLDLQDIKYLYRFANREGRKLRGMSVNRIPSLNFFSKLFKFRLLRSTFVKTYTGIPHLVRTSISEHSFNKFCIYTISIGALSG